MTGLGSSHLKEWMRYWHKKAIIFFRRTCSKHQVNTRSRLDRNSARDDDGEASWQPYPARSEQMNAALAPSTAPTPGSSRERLRCRVRGSLLAQRPQALAPLGADPEESSARGVARLCAPSFRHAPAACVLRAPKLDDLRDCCDRRPSREVCSGTPHRCPVCRRVEHAWEDPQHERGGGQSRTARLHPGGRACMHEPLFRPSRPLSPRTPGSGAAASERTRWCVAAFATP